jgi:hypothetical protein
MRRALLCLLTLPFALNVALAQSSTPRTPPPIPLLPQQATPTPAPAPAGLIDCRATPSPTTSYPILAPLPRTDAYLEYAGTLLTWTPIDNATECHIRQILFNVPDTMDNGTAPGGKGVAPDISVQLVRHTTGDLIEAAQSYDIVTEKNGPYILYRIDVQAPEVLIGDYDLKISIVGYPKPTSPHSTKK